MSFFSLPRSRKLKKMNWNQDNSNNNSSSYMLNLNGQKKKEKNLRPWRWLIGDRDDLPDDNKEKIARIVIGVIWMLAPVFIFIFAGIFPVSEESGECVAWRPQNNVYTIAWSFIVVLLLFSWILVSRAKKSPLGTWIGHVILYFLVIMLCVFWIIFYRIDPLNGVTVFIFLLMTLGVLIVATWKSSRWGCAFLIPVLVWAVFQMSVNCAEMNC